MKSLLDLGLSLWWRKPVEDLTLGTVKLLTFEEITLIMAGTSISEVFNNEWEMIGTRCPYTLKKCTVQEHGCNRNCVLCSQTFQSWSYAFSLRGCGEYGNHYITASKANTLNISSPPSAHPPISYLLHLLIPRSALYFKYTHFPDKNIALIPANTHTNADRKSCTSQNPGDCSVRSGLREKTLNAVIVRVCVCVFMVRPIKAACFMTSEMSPLRSCRFDSSSHAPNCAARSTHTHTGKELSDLRGGKVISYKIVFSCQ